MRELTLKQRQARAEQRNRRYRECARYRLEAINRSRKARGTTELAELAHSRELRVPIPASL
jgi:hypothetical protein